MDDHIGPAHGGEEVGQSPHPGGRAEIGVAVHLPERARGDGVGRSRSLVALGSRDDGGVETLGEKNHVLSTADRIELAGQGLKPAQEHADLLRVDLTLLAHHHEGLFARFVGCDPLSALGFGGDRDSRVDAGVENNAEGIAIAAHIAAAYGVYGLHHLNAVGAEAQEDLHSLRRRGHNGDEVPRTHFGFDEFPRRDPRAFDRHRAREGKVEEKDKLTSRRELVEIRHTVDRHAEVTVTGNREEAFDRRGLAAILDLEILGSEPGDGFPILVGDEHRHRDDIHFRAEGDRFLLILTGRRRRQTGGKKEDGSEEKNAGDFHEASRARQRRPRKFKSRLHSERVSASGSTV